MLQKSTVKTDFFLVDGHISLVFLTNLMYGRQRAKRRQLVSVAEKWVRDADRPSVTGVGFVGSVPGTALYRSDLGLLPRSEALYWVPLNISSYDVMNGVVQMIKTHF